MNSVRHGVLMNSADWSEWRPFPDPRKGDYLVAPFGPGVYDLRNRATGESVLFGIGGHTAQRLSSLLPEPFGTGRRNNAQKREYVLENVESIEYRTIACASKKEARAIEMKLKRSFDYLFNT